MGFADLEKALVELWSDPENRRLLRRASKHRPRKVVDLPLTRLDDPVPPGEEINGE